MTQDLCKHVNVMADDTDVFLLLCYYYHYFNFICRLIQTSTSREKAAIDISATVAQHGDIMPQMIRAHAQLDVTQYLTHMVLEKQQLLSKC